MARSVVSKALICKKVFDTIDHDILLQKLYASGFRKQSVNWFQSYLTSRLCLVNFEKKFSQSAHVCSDAPQRSVLGPLLFLIYINEMPPAVKCNIFFCANY